jgi:NADPH-dependent 7-cyano-7-deazaguanine reductase QueF-like protein
MTKKQQTLEIIFLRNESQAHHTLPFQKARKRVHQYLISIYTRKVYLACRQKWPFAVQLSYTYPYLLNKEAWDRYMFSSTANNDKPMMAIIEVNIYTRPPTLKKKSLFLKLLSRQKAQFSKTLGK